MNLEEQWNRLTAWCTEYAPLTATSIRPGASLDEIRVVENSLDIAWPGELVEFYQLQNGQSSWNPGSDFFAGTIFPSKEILSLPDILQLRETMLEAWKTLEISPDFDTLASNAPQAGTVSYTFHPLYIPFASLDDVHYVVDCRPGPQHGCVIEYAHESVDEGGVEFESVASLLAALADSLYAGTKFGFWKASVEEGLIDWSIP
ncbi:SMI1/KNR4 family protein [Rhodococcus sp. IEGM 1379]|uniref:SMI1/KNR4 family protein n=1 Tax=Rhodococcus sp. IEGM 1379 TaxID=3047086 RepID=UPI0024B8241D|nr:SMI1/KNR4 family protein [Rhodococcus sp. IEGM 1379]MDI9918370.1 SMI1/KNR4 family protein [Rhodococcus sp. IEGM 1379]